MFSNNYIYFRIVIEILVSEIGNSLQATKHSFKSKYIGITFPQLNKYKNERISILSSLSR